MKKLIALVATLVMLSSYGIGYAQTDAGPFCFDFTSYCDGLELSLNGQTKVITGFWVNWDCYNSRQPIDWGKLLTGPYGYGAYVIATLPLYGQYGFFIDVPMDGTMNMYKNNPPWGIWLTNLAYTMTPGPCPFADNVGDPSHSTIWIE